MVSGTITSEQLKNILDVNSKSIEMNLEVSRQYDEVIEKLNDLKSDTSEFNLMKEFTDGFAKDKINLMLYKQTFDGKIGDLIKLVEESKAAVIDHNRQMDDTLKKIDKAILKQELVIGGSVVTMILAILSKLLLGI